MTDGFQYPFEEALRADRLLQARKEFMHPDILLRHAEIEDRHWWFVARRRIVEQFLRLLIPAGSGRTVLDLGCGTGGNLGALSSDYACTGLEIDETAVQAAKCRYPGVEFRRASILDPGNWPIKQRVDACLMMDVLEHLEDDRGAVKNATRILKPGGYLLITVPAEPTLWSRHDDLHEHLRRYDPAGIRAIMSDLALEEVLITAFNARLFWPIMVWRRLRERMLFLHSRGTTGYLHMPPAPINQILRWIFQGESGRLQAAFEGSSPGYTRGVSLLVVLRKPSNG